VALLAFHGIPVSRFDVLVGPFLAHVIGTHFRRVSRGLGLRPLPTGGAVIFWLEGASRVMAGEVCVMAPLGALEES
jgi:hypothetical protein